MNPALEHCGEDDFEVKPHRQVRQVMRPLKIPVDILVYSQAEIDMLQGSCTGAVYWAMREGGKLLYAAPN